MLVALGARFAENVSFYIFTLIVITYATAQAGAAKADVLHAIEGFLPAIEIVPQSPGPRNAPHRTLLGKFTGGIVLGAPLAGKHGLDIALEGADGTLRLLGTRHFAVMDRDQTKPVDAPLRQALPPMTPPGARVQFWIDEIGRAHV